MSDNQRPPHPGEILRDHVLSGWNLTVEAAARQLAISASDLAAVLDGQADITPELAVRIETWLGAGNGGSARIWLQNQNNYDLWLARARGVSGVQPVEVPDSSDMDAHSDPGGWNYRVIEFPCQGGETYRTIHEVHYSNGIPVARSGPAAEVSWDTGEGDEAGLLILDRMRDAIHKPALVASDFGTVNE